MQDRREQINKQDFLNNLIDSDKENVFVDRDFLSKHETLKRISQKFNSIYLRYHEAIDKDILFFFCEQIITEFVKDLGRDYLVIAKKKDKDGKYADDISTILIMMDTRIQRMIDEWRGTYRIERGKNSTVYVAPYFESFDEPLNKNQSDGDGWYTDTPTTYGDIASLENNLTYSYSVDYEKSDAILKRVYKKAKLTHRQIEILEALERTSDNAQGETYTKAHAADILRCESSNVSNIFSTIKKNITKAYPNMTFTISRKERIEVLEDFLDSVETENDVIDFILNGLGDDDVDYIFYEVDCELRKHFILNFIRCYNEDVIFHKKTRKFCRNFLKELYDYIDLLRYNDRLTKPRKCKKPKQDEKIVYMKDFLLK